VGQHAVNGNLLSDGVYTYGYDHANRLVSVTSNQLSVSSYQYNGQGDRLRQTVNGVTTNYTLDLHSGLTQVLADGTNTYLYGRSRLAEKNAAGTAYDLADALGSVRQLADGAGQVTLARSYKPYGEPLSSQGAGATSYGFTGEATDATGMVYLRARYYAPGVGRFTSRDTWAGDAKMPMSYNGWVYAVANPIGYTDPSGLCIHCALGDWVKVDARKTGGRLAVRSDPMHNNVVVDYVSDNQYVQVTNQLVGNDWWGWRRINVIVQGGAR
jgi:RHS repeat-associated protein